MKVKELMIYCTNRGCVGCQYDKECAVFHDRFHCSPGLEPTREMFAEKINIVSDHGNEEIE